MPPWVNPKWIVPVEKGHTPRLVFSQGFSRQRSSLLGELFVVMVRRLLYLPSLFMVEFLFYFFSALILGSALMVVLNRNPVNAAMFLLLVMAGAAAMFFVLEAFFLGVLQILVYAGAVVVLFLFIIMLIAPQTKLKPSPGKGAFAISGTALALLAFGALYLAGSVAGGLPLSETQPVGHVSKDYGYFLFSVYLLPFMVAGFLLLIAMVGVILISKRFPGEKPS